jgi:hypothetical protein
VPLLIPIPRPSRTHFNEMAPYFNEMIP